MKFRGVMIFNMKKYFIMNKDKPLLEYAYTLKDGFLRPVIIDGDIPLPYQKFNLSSFLDSRSIAKKRNEIRHILKSMNLKTQKDILDVTYGLSLTDTLWVKPADSVLKWSDINLYENDFDETIGKLSILGEKMISGFKTTSPEFGTDGMLPKCWVRRADGIYMLKGGTSGSSSMGREPVTEELAYQLEKALDINCVSYKTEIYHGKTVSCCKLMTDTNRGITPLYALSTVQNFYDLIDTGKKYGIEKDLKTMLSFDILTGNNDRHQGNIQLMFDNDTFEIQGLSPVFDNGQALCNRIPEIKFENMQEQFYRRYPALYDDFYDYYDSIVSEEFYCKLRGIQDFEFTDNGFLSDNELCEYNKFIQWRIKDMILRYENI